MSKEIQDVIKDKHNKAHELEKIRDTLLQKYGPNNKYGVKNEHGVDIIDDQFTTSQMVFSIIEHYRRGC